MSKLNEKEVIAIPGQIYLYFFFHTSAVKIGGFAPGDLMDGQLVMRPAGIPKVINTNLIEPFILLKG
jgi:hypothetical protein